jgi:polar amino acid transport system substrate-binding protein
MTKSQLMTGRHMFVRVLGILALHWLLWMPVQAQDAAPTLTPPTLVPQPAAQVIDALPSESGIAQIVRAGRVRVGILFNEPPFGELNVRGDVSGFDANLARAMAEAWGVEIALVQVTRQTALDMLAAGDVELLMAALPHMRAFDSRIEFSQTYYPTNQALLVREGDGAAGLADMANRRIGVVLGTRAEEAVAYWQRRTGIQISVQPYLTLDQAIVALVNSEIDGVVANRIRLTRAVTQPGIARFVEEPVMPEPLAAAVRRQDIHLRNLINRTLQYLEASGKLSEIHRTNFANAAYPGLTRRYANIGEDAPRPDQFGQDIPFPAQYVIPRMQTDSTLRVAGLTDLPADAPASERLLDSAQRALVQTLAGRWGVNVVSVPGGGEQVESGAADLLVGVQADWNMAGQVDFTAPYIARGELLMLPANSAVSGFGDLRGRIICIFNSEPEAEARVLALAQDARAILGGFFRVLREQDAAFSMLADNNCNAVFGDSLRILPLVQAQPDALKLLTDQDGRARLYSRSLFSLAVARNDVDFRLLVEYTLQEMALDGTLAQILAAVLPPGDAVQLEIWPGSAEYLGYNLAFRG